jgi:hypothetical protein
VKRESSAWHRQTEGRVPPRPEPRRPARIGRSGAIGGLVGDSWSTYFLYSRLRGDARQVRHGSHSPTSDLKDDSVQSGMSFPQKAALPFLPGESESNGSAGNRAERFSKDPPLKRKRI